MNDGMNGLNNHAALKKIKMETCVNFWDKVKRAFYLIIKRIFDVVGASLVVYFCYH